MCIICGVDNNTSRLSCINCGWDFTHDVFTYSSVSGLTQNELGILALNVKNAQKYLLPDDIHTKTTVEIITFMFKRYGKDVFLNSDQLKTLMKIWLSDRADELKKYLYAVEKNIPQLILNNVNDKIKIEVTIKEVKKELSENLFLKDSFIDLVVDGLAVAFGLIDERKYQNAENYTNVTEFEFSNGTINKYIGNLKEVSIPSVINNEKVAAIGNNAFKNCSSLTQITIPNSVSSISAWAFFRCRKLTQIIIPNSVSFIGEFAFGNCSSLTQITIPDSVTHIENYAFYRSCFLTIYANRNSFAAEYARKNYIKIIYN